MQSDGNLVTYGPAGALWSSQSQGDGTGFAKMQSDGNFVVYDAGSPRFATGTKGSDFLRLQSDANLVIYGASGALWASNTIQPVIVAPGSTTLGLNEEMLAGSYLSAADGRFDLVLQGDGNLVLYERGIVLFATSTFTTNPVMIMQTDGNLVLYGLGRALWASNTSSAGTQALLQGDGNFVVNHVGVVTFATGTNQPATGVGVYGGFGTDAVVASAIGGGWPVIGDAGALGTMSAPYTAEVQSQPDLHVARSIASAGSASTWLSFWTVSGPSPGDNWNNAGYLAGRQAATTLDLYGAKPSFVILDPEGYNGEPNTCAAQLDGSPGNPADWALFLAGWATGIHSLNGRLTPSFYANQCQYNSGDLAAIRLPAFVAVSPVFFSGGSGNKPGVSGGNIRGYIAYYGGCLAAPYEATVNSWGAPYNTIQFSDSGVDCGA